MLTIRRSFSGLKVSGVLEHPRFLFTGPPLQPGPLIRFCAPTGQWVEAVLPGYPIVSNLR